MSLFSQQVDSIQVFYLPWQFNIEGEVTEELVRNYPGYSRKMTVKDEPAIADFLQSINLLNLRLQTGARPKFVPKMVLDVYTRMSLNGHDFSPSKQTFYLDSRQNLKHHDALYYKNFALEAWLNNYILKY